MSLTKYRYKETGVMPISTTRANLKVLLIELEFPTWEKARHWSYGAQLGIEEGFQANGVEFFTIPAIWGRSSSASNSWLRYAPELCAGKRFDQVWVEIVHSGLDERFLEWLATLAPVCIGFLPESLEYTPEEYALAPNLRGRKSLVEKRFKYLTHVLACDEKDADDINSRGLVRAMWWPAALPKHFICKQISPVLNNYAIFYGELYGQRRAWLECPDLKGALVRPNLPEDISDYPKCFDELNRAADSVLKTGTAVNESVLFPYLNGLRRIRRELFALWQQGLQTGCAVVNLPHLVKTYAGRVVETMAAGRPVISWEVPNRPRNKALFDDGREILLFNKEDPSQLASHIRRLQREPDFSKVIADNAREKVLRYHTVETRVRQILDWIETGEEPDYGEMTSTDQSEVAASCASSKKIEMNTNVATYFIKPGYVPRLQPEYFGDVSGDRIVYQPDVYPVAAFLGQRLNCLHIVDIGCGTAQKLVALYPQFQIIGIDYGANIQFCRQKYSFGQWVDLNLETGAPIPIEIQILKRAIIICSDVIEHLVDPIPLLRNIKTLLEHAPAAILTTPERDLTRGLDDLGPPSNPCHVREWNLKELELLLRSEKLNVLFAGLTTSNNKECEKKTSLVIVGNNHTAHNSVLSEAMHTASDRWFEEPAQWDANTSSKRAMVNQPSLSVPSECAQFRMIAIIAAYNEGDVIFHVIGDLIDNGVEVYLIDNNSTDNTVPEASKWLGKGLLHIERFPQDSGYPERSAREYVWRDLLRRKEELAAQLGAAWYIHADADEFRESPWPGMTLAEAIRWVDSLGYNAINFELLNFRPTDEGFIPGSDVRKHLTHWELGDWFDVPQIKAWKNTGQPIQLAQSGGHKVEFPGRRVCPIPFILRHYPIRGETHGRQKIFRERLPRFAPEERAAGWHVQYNSFLNGEVRFIRDPSTLISYDPHAVRSKILARILNEVLLFSILRGRDWISSPMNESAVSDWLGSTLGLPPIPFPVIQQADKALNTLLQEAAKNRWQCNTPVDATDVPLLKAMAKIKAALSNMKGDHLMAKRWADLGEQIHAPRSVKGVSLADRQSFLSKETLYPHYEEVKELIRQGKRDEAIDTIERLLDSYPDHPLAHNDLGVLYFEKGDREQALAHIEQAVRLDPDCLDSQINLADLYIELGRPRQALEIYERILVSHPEDIETILRIGHWCSQAGRPEDAKLFYKKVLDIEPQNEAARQGLEILNHRSFGSLISEEKGNPSRGTNSGDQNQKLVSIILLAHNQLEYTKKCLDSVFQHTGESFELIIVDNGSSDGTPEYLDSLKEGRITVGGWRLRVGEEGEVKEERPEKKKKKRRKRSEMKQIACKRFKVIRNEENLGFARGNNQGMAVARGDYLLLMNNDVVVTPGWLGRMIACVERKPKIGIVGPMSNYVSGPQWVKEVTYDTRSLAGLNQFAQDYAQKQSGQAKPFWRVVGFCMLIKRSVVEKIGGLDGRYGLGNFEDDDFSLRARLAGFESWITEDCFVHHFGNRTFEGARIDYRESLNQNWEIFKKKWGIPAEVEYGAPYDMAQVLNQGFIPAKHCCPLNPEEFSVSRGEAFFQSGDVEGAKEIFNRVLHENPKQVDALNNLGVISFQEGEIDRAVSYFDQVLELDPDHLDALENLGYCLVAREAYSEAIRCFKKALDLKPVNVNLLNSLANCFVQTEDFTTAEEIYTRSHQLDCTQTHVKEILAEIGRLKAIEVERRATP